MRPVYGAALAGDEDLALLSCQEQGGRDCFLTFFHIALPREEEIRSHKRSGFLKGKGQPALSPWPSSQGRVSPFISFFAR